MDRIAIIVGQCVSHISKALGLGAGATWPGEVALFLSPSILRTLWNRCTKGVILVAGTNGKTTTTRMIEDIIQGSGQSVIHNTSGANLVNGIVSALLTQKKADFGVFEVDENVLPEVLSRMHGGQKIYVVLLNLFRDQLDRYGEVDTVAEKWKKALAEALLDMEVIINADDPHLSSIGKRLTVPVRYFGIDNPKLYLPRMQHATDTIYCPECGSRLSFDGVYFSHLGSWTCPECHFCHPKMQIVSTDVSCPLEGVYNIYNVMAATLAGMCVGVSLSVIRKKMATFTPAFGRMETLVINGTSIRILLSKNPTGFNESLRTYKDSKGKGPLLLVLNDRIPDGTDVSWIWDVDFEMLDARRKIIVSGDRALDMGVRMKYGGLMSTVSIEAHLHTALNRLLDSVKKGETGWILATYSAMLDVRKILIGKKIL